MILIPPDVTSGERRPLVSGYRGEDVETARLNAYQDVSILNKQNSYSSGAAGSASSLLKARLWASIHSVAVRIFLLNYVHIFYIYRKNRNYCMKKTKVPRLFVGKNCMILGSLVLTHYQRVTDRQTDRHTAYS